jgi:hypothetical protein
MKTIDLPGTDVSDRLLAIKIMLDIAYAAARRITDQAELFAYQQRQRIQRCQDLEERIDTLEVQP